MFVLVFLLAAVLPILSLAAVVLTFVASWKVHEKAGLPGWSGIVPYYNYYARAEKCGAVDKFWKSIKMIAITFGVMIVGSLLISLISGVALLGAGVAASSDATEAAIGAMGGSVIISALLGIALVIACWVLAIIAIVQLVKIDIAFISHFGKGTGFAIGMLFLPYIFYPILAWGQAYWDDDDNFIDVAPGDGAPMV